MDAAPTCLRVLVPIPMSVDRLTLSAARQETLNTRHKEILGQWLVWHFGAFTTHGLRFPLHGTLMRLANDALDGVTLEQILMPIREGVDRWVYADIPLTARRGVIYWSYAQKEQGSRVTTAVHIALQESP